MVCAYREEVSVATYPYRCPEHGDFDVHRPIGTAAGTSLCPCCSADAIRVFSAPMLAHTSRAVAAALQRDEKSREAPEVVTAPPSRRPVRQQQATNPVLRSLPRS
jgi:hypothetical protein